MRWALTSYIVLLYWSAKSMIWSRLRLRTGFAAHGLISAADTSTSIIIIISILVLRVKTFRRCVLKKSPWSGCLAVVRFKFVLKSWQITAYLYLLCPRLITFANCKKKKCTNCVTKFLIKLWSMSNFEIKALFLSEINLQQLNNLTFDLWCDNRLITLVSTECSVILFSANDKCTPAKIFKLNIPFITIWYVTYVFFRVFFFFLAIYEFQCVISPYFFKQSMCCCWKCHLMAAGH